MSGHGSVAGLVRVAILAALAVSLGLIWSELDWAAIGNALARVYWPAALLASGFVLLAVVAKSARWQALLAPAIPVGWWRALALVLAGQLANNGLPLRVGEAARIALLDPGAAGRAYVVSTIVAEKLLDAAGLTLAAALLALLLPLPDWLRLASPLLAFGGAGTFAGAAWAGARWGPRWLAPHARSALAGMVALARPRTLARALAWTGAGLAAGAAANWWSLVALGIEAGLEGALLVLLALYIGGALPAPPGRLGVFQALCVAALLPLGVGPSAALAFGVLHYVVVVILPSMVSALYLAIWVGWRAEWRRKASGGAISCAPTQGRSGDRAP